MDALNPKSLPEEYIPTKNDSIVDSGSAGGAALQPGSAGPSARSATCSTLPVPVFAGATIARARPACEVSDMTRAILAQDYDDGQPVSRLAFLSAEHLPAAASLALSGLGMDVTPGRGISLDAVLDDPRCGQASQTRPMHNPSRALQQAILEKLSSSSLAHCAGQPRAQAAQPSLLSSRSSATWIVTSASGSATAAPSLLLGNIQHGFTPSSSSATLPQTNFSPHAASDGQSRPCGLESGSTNGDISLLVGVKRTGLDSPAMAPRPVRRKRATPPKGAPRICRICEQDMTEETQGVKVKKTECRRCSAAILRGHRSNKRLGEIKEAIRNGTLEQLLPGYKYTPRKATGEDANLAPTVQRCYMCEEVKPLEAYHKNANRANGRAKNCKACDHIRIRGHRLGLTLQELKQHMQNGTITEVEGLVLPMKVTATDKVENIPDGHRMCRTCGKVKLLSHFVRNSKCADGISHFCSPCMTSINAARKERLTTAKLAERIAAQQELPPIYDESGSQECAVCGHNKALTEYNRSVHAKSGFNTICRGCALLEQRAIRLGYQHGRRGLQEAMWRGQLDAVVASVPGLHVPHNFTPPDVTGLSEEDIQIRLSRRRMATGVAQRETLSGARQADTAVLRGSTRGRRCQGVRRNPGAHQIRRLKRSQKEEWDSGEDDEWDSAAETQEDEDREESRARVNAQPKIETEIDPQTSARHRLDRQKLQMPHLEERVDLDRAIRLSMLQAAEECVSEDVSQRVQDGVVQAFGTGGPVGRAA